MVVSVHDLNHPRRRGGGVIWQAVERGKRPARSEANGAPAANRGAVGGHDGKGVVGRRSGLQLGASGYGDGGPEGGPPHAPTQFHVRLQLGADRNWRRIAGPNHGRTNPTNGPPNRTGQPL